ncbi:MAG: glycosyltransferase, partial [Methylocystis sp.]|nr:glycosyltransferase [Methylocystis sp.]
AVLLAEGLVAEEAFYRTLARHLDVDFLDESANIASSGDMAAKAECGFARLAEAPHGILWLFAPRGAAIGRLMSAARGAHGRPLFALTTPSLFAAALRSTSPRYLARLAAFTAERANPELCVRTAMRRWTVIRFIAANGILLACLFAPIREISLTAALFYSVASLSSVFLRLFACAASFDDPNVAPELDDAALPAYSIVVALYKEAAVAPQLARAIDRLNYPRAKLDVKFIVEDDDWETAEALRTNAPHTPHEIIVAPAGAPRTKPRALNVAMPFLRGSLVAIFDAEDLPEPDQLRKAAAIFAGAPPEVACLQANLCIDNGVQNWLTGLFAIEYAILFEVFDKGLAALGLPLFLGGAANHFRLRALRDAGYWDAFNVTEDADLGLRLARAGYEVRTFPSRTYEEAPANFPALLGQRTRWVKGWMLTAIVHCRRPLDLLADLGALRAGAVLAMFSGGFAGPLLGPFFALFLAYHAAFGNLLSPATTVEIALSTLWCFLALSG